jgi:hypothetical protein
MHQLQRQDPFIFQLISLLFADQTEDVEAAPFSMRTVLTLIALAALGAIVVGLLSGVVSL